MSSTKQAMKSIICVCVLFHVISVNNAQFGGYFGRSNPFFGGWGGFPQFDPLTAALFFGFGKHSLEFIYLQTIY